MMKTPLLFLLTAAAGVLGLGACGHVSEPAVEPDLTTFHPARQVLEANCVHCHGDYRLKGMPPIATTRQLAKLVGPGNWIIPGKPEQSRLFQVVTFPDEIPNAMPPTGHAIAPVQVKLLRDWILAGAPVPAGANQKLQPTGEAPRSR
jgi:mono/diheme cytochrome c family protein